MGLHRYYLLGRDDADEDLDLDQFDAEDLARRVLTGTPIRDLTITALTDLLAIDPHDGSQAEWIDDHEDDLEEDEVDPETAYKEWRRGWLDEGAHQLEEEIVEAMHEVLEDMDDEAQMEEEARRRPRRNGNGDGPTYGDYERTGIQDCGNVWSGDEIDIAAVARQIHGRPVPERQKAIDAAIEAVWAEDGDAIFEQWSEQNADDVADAGLELQKAFDAWKSGYRSCQRRLLAGWISDEQARLDDV